MVPWFLFDSDALEKLVGSAWFSSQKIENMLGFNPEWNLEKALPGMVAEMRKAETGGTNIQHPTLNIQRRRSDNGKTNIERATF